MADDKDINISVGAKIDVEAAKAAVLSSFRDIQKKLKEVGTNEARELAKQISQVAKGLSSGEIDFKDAEALAAEFGKAAKFATLSDKKVDDLASHLKKAVYESRSMADSLKKAESGFEKSRKITDGLSGLLDKIGPKAGGISNSISGWTRSIPGLEGAIGKLGGAAKAAGGWFMVALKTIELGIGAIKDYAATYRKYEDRALRESGEDAVNAQTNATAALDLRIRKIDEELRRKQAIADADFEIAKANKEIAHSQERISAETELQRENLERIHRREMEDLEIEKQKDDLARERAQITEKLNAIEGEGGKKSILSERQEAEKARLAEMQKQLDAADKYRSEYERQMEEAQRNGWDTSSSTIAEQVGTKFRAWGIDLGKDMMATLGLNKMGTEEGNQRYEGFRAQVRSQKQLLASLDSQMKTLDADASELRLQGGDIDKKSQVVSAREDVLAKRRDEEDMASERQFTEKVRGIELDNLKGGNRLTAMGLAGNPMANAEIETANNTKTLVGIAKNIHRRLGNTKPLVDPATWK